MRVADIMSSRPVTVPPTATLGTVARMLALHGVTALPVVDGHDRVVGIIGEADLIAHGITAPDGGLADPVGAVIGHRTVVVHPETGLAEAGEVFATTSYKSIPVVDAADQVVGIVSRSDLVRALGRGDDELEQDITDLLARCGVRECRVRVRNGVVSVAGPVAAADLTTIIELVSATPGVNAVHAG